VTSEQAAVVGEQDTIYDISEAVFTANHLTDTDKLSSTVKYTN